MLVGVDLQAVTFEVVLHVVAVGVVLHAVAARLVGLMSFAMPVGVVLVMDFWLCTKLMD